MSASNTSSSEHASKRQKVTVESLCTEVSISSWREGVSRTSSTYQDHSHDRLPLVDLRSKQSYSQRRLKDSCTLSLIVHLPFEDLLSGERSCELPPRHVEFAILVPTGFDRLQLDDFFFATQSKATAQSRKPWLVRQIIQEDGGMWDEAKQMGIVSLSNGGGIEFPLPRLWKPDHMIEHILLPLLSQKFSDGNDDFVVYDLGSGAGRDVCFISEEMKHLADTKDLRRKIKVVGFDNHKGSGRRSKPLWKNRMVDDVTESRLVNLKNMEVFAKNIKDASGTLGCIYAIRYLNRRMLDHIASNSSLESGCIFAMSHFCKEKGAAWDWDHPKVRGIHMQMHSAHWILYLFCIHMQYWIVSLTYVLLQSKLLYAGNRTLNFVNMNIHTFKPMGLDNF